MNRCVDVCRVVTWNLERRRPTSPSGGRALEVLAAAEPDVMVLTESWANIDPPLGYLLPAPEAPLGRRFKPDERKVVLWSRQPWTDVGQIELGDVDRSRLATAVTTTPLGAIRVIGICVPWHMCEVRSPVGQTRAPWELHREFLHHLCPILEQCDVGPLVVAGDFNQRVPRIKGGNRQAADLLQSTFAALTVATEGHIAGCQRQGIDHIAHSVQLRATRVWGWPSTIEDIRLSDHDAAAVDLAIAESSATK